MRNLLILICIPLLFLQCSKKEQLIFKDGFDMLSRGPLGSDVGAHTEYHYIAEARPRGQWTVSTFRYNLPSSWYVRQWNGKNAVVHDGENPNIHWHPILVSGDDKWQDYTLHASFSPLSKSKQAGILFRYQNDRQYYMFGVKNDSVFVKSVNHGRAFRQPNEKVLYQQAYHYVPDNPIEVSIKLEGRDIYISNHTLNFSVTDSLFKKGKIGLLADMPTVFHYVNVYAPKVELKRVQTERQKENEELNRLKEEIPRPVVWKKIDTKDYGTARNIRFGDLNNDGKPEILLGQVVHHGHKDRNSELSCLTAIDLDGNVLWQKGRPDEWKTMLTNDVAFQIHDIDNDGRSEVVYTMGQELMVVDGATGNLINKMPTPLSPGGKPTQQGHNLFPRILGDCLYFCDLTGQGFDGDFIIKDRYLHLWAFNNQLKLLWKNSCNTGHYPYAEDVDGDDRDELMMGYTLFDDNGEILWSLDTVLSDHADGVAIVPFMGEGQLKTMIAASDEGIVFTDINGSIEKHHYIGHVQNPAIANFRDDLPGLETVSVNFWGNQGIIHLFDAHGNIYHTFEPNAYGSMCSPLNWTGKTEELFVLNANVDEGGAYDGWGRKVFDFPDDGHPDMCFANLDIMGDGRDEIVVWDSHEIWIYTQHDNPKEGKLYKPRRNPLYNMSNYQATVSLP
jgi:rhamnogalacturonan endolyase